MKNRFLFVVLMLAGFSGTAQNRIATQADRAIYGDYIIPGDLIIDTPTKSSKGHAQVVYYFMKRQWPGLREGGTIWLDGAKLGFLKLVKFANTAHLAPWHIESASIKNIPHTQVKMAAFSCQGLKHVLISGVSEQFPGLWDWPKERKFLTGAFGLHVINRMFGGHGFEIGVLDGGTVKLSGFEVQHGFSGVRINGGSYDITVNGIEISNFYIHDTGDGEGMYLGATHKPPLAKIMNLKVHHGIITRTAAEALQFQHLVGGADVHNITIRAADVRWMHEFMRGQDTGIQWNLASGVNKLHHIIVDGFGSVGLVPFGSDQNPVGGVSEVRDILFNGGQDTGMYLHKSGSHGMQWVFDNLYFRGFTSTYYACTGTKERKYYVSKPHGTDQYTFKKVIHDGTKQNVFEKPDSVIVGEVVRQELPAPEYINSGLPEASHRIKQWFQHYAAYFPASRSGTVKVMTEWKPGDIAIETQGEYAFYKCTVAHEGGKSRPARNPNFMKLTWDEDGIRSDDPAWNRTARQSNFPPDDLRLEKDNYWRKLGFGFIEDDAVVTADKKQR